MKFSFGSFFLLVLIIQLIDLNFAKKKELQTLALLALLGSHRGNNQPHMIPIHPLPYGNHYGGYGAPQ